MLHIHKVLLSLVFFTAVLSAREVLEIDNEVPEQSEIESNTGDLEEIDTPLNTWIIPIDRQIDNATEAIVRRAFEDPRIEEIDLIVLKMDTPGGRLDSTLEIMELLDSFDGITMTYVTSEALSAGAYISAATDEIYMAPKSIIGAAAVITGTGEDIAETAKQKIDSVLKAKIRTLDRDYRYRSDVIRAMMDAEFEFKIGDEIIKPAGELLSLTDEEASQEYGTPPEALLSFGSYESLEEMLDARFGADLTIDQKFQLTWSEELAFVLNSFTPIVLSIGFLLILVEFKTPGFGLFGALGIGIFVFVFISQFVAGFAGHEPLILFVIGVALVLVEVFVIPGTFVSGFLGFGMMTGALIWVLIGELPSEGYQWDFALIAGPINDILLGFAIAVVGFLAILRFLPKNLFWDKLILASSVGGGSTPQTAKEVGDVIANVQDRPAIGTQGTAATDLMPSGFVDIKGRRMEAQAARGSIVKGQDIVISGYASYSLIVKALTREESQ